MKRAWIGVGVLVGFFVLAMFLLADAAVAQTAPPPPAPSPNAGAFDKLSPGNQKIAEALFEAQQASTAPGAPKPLSRDDIAAMKQSGRGWGEIFKDMKQQGLVTEKNLGQAVSRFNHEHRLPPPGREARGEEAAHVRAGGTSLQDFEQKLLAQGRSGAPVEARFRGVSLTQAEQQRLLGDIRNLNAQLPEGSRVRVEGQIDGRLFRAEVRNHEGEREVNLRGIQFATREDAQTFVSSLRQPGDERVRVRGTVDGQRFDARFRADDGRVQQQFRTKPAEHGTQITTASGRSWMVDSHGSRGNPAASGRSFKGGDGDRGGASAGASGQVSASGRGSDGGGASAGQSGGHGGGHGR